MRRTIDTIGIDAVRGTTIVTRFAEFSLDHSSPDRFVESASKELLRRMPLKVACEIQVIAGDRLDYPSEYRPGGEDQPARILVSDETLVDPLRAVMELAYQYARHFWESNAVVMPLDTDPRTTNLLPICCGLGVLASDASLYDEQWSQAGWTGWSISRSGYYSAVEIGYAMALLARARGETDPDWLGALRLDSRVTAQKAWRYFRDHEGQGGALLFDSRKIPTTDTGASELAAWLAGEDLAFALAAAFALARREELPPLVIQAALRASESGDDDLIPAATRLLGKSRAPDVEVHKRIRELIRSPAPLTSMAAIQSASAIGIPLADFSTRLSKLLDTVADDSCALIDVIAREGVSLSGLGPKLCMHLAGAIREVDEDRARALIECLQQIAEDPQRLIESRIKSEPIRKEALQRLAMAT